MPLKTTNSSTSENSWMPVREYCDLYLSYSAWVHQNCRIYQHNYYENLQLTLVEEMENSSTVVRTTMLGMTGKHVDRWDEK